jgi:hypothetical protein
MWWKPVRTGVRREIRRQRVTLMRGFRHWRWHLDEMDVKLNGEMVYLWQAIDQEGEVLESYVTRTRDRTAALRFMKKVLKRHGSRKRSPPMGALLRQRWTARLPRALSDQRGRLDVGAVSARELVKLAPGCALVRPPPRGRKGRSSCESPVSRSSDNNPSPAYRTYLLASGQRF